MTAFDCSDASQAHKQFKDESFGVKHSCYINNVKNFKLWQMSTVILQCKDPLCEDYLDVRIEKLGTNNCILTAMILLSKDNLMQGQFVWNKRSLYKRKNCCISWQPTLGQTASCSRSQTSYPPEAIGTL